MTIESARPRPFRPALGVLLFSDYSLAELCALGELCEELGFRSFWYTDIRFARECYLGLAAVAAGTKRLLLGPGVTDPYSRHPGITAATIATFDELCGGRALLGLGVGGQGFRELGIVAPLPVAALRETIEVVRALLRGEQVDKQGKVISLDRAKLGFEPLRASIPIYIATHGAQIARLAGQVADGVLIANTLLPRMFEFYFDRVREGMESVDRAADSFDIGLRVEACISDDQAGAFAVMRRRMASRIIGQYPHWSYLDELGVKLPPRFVEIAASKDDSRLAEAAGMLPPEVVERTVLAGTPARVAEQLAGVLRPEVTSLTVRPHAAPGERIEDVIRLFANEVMPRVDRLVADRASA